MEGTKAFLEKIQSQESSEEIAEGLSQTFPILLAGTVPEALKAVDEHYRGLPNLEIIRFRKNLKPRIKIEASPPEQVGDDRIAGILGALSFDRTVPWVVIDAGTALTVDAVQPGLANLPAVFMGGLIIPGEKMCLQALHDGTGQLPLCEPMDTEKHPASFGRSTKEAIVSGVRRSQIASTLALIRTQLRKIGDNVRIAVTGGGANTVYKTIQEVFLDKKPLHDPLLVDKGLFEAWNLTK